MRCPIDGPFEARPRGFGRGQSMCIRRVIWVPPTTTAMRCPKMPVDLGRTASPRKWPTISEKKFPRPPPRKIRHAATSLFHKGFYVAATKHNPQRCATSAEKRHTLRRFGLSATPEAFKYMVCGQSLRRCGNFEGGVGKINSIDGRKDTVGFGMIQCKLPQQVIVFVADQIEATTATKR